MWLRQGISTSNKDIDVDEMVSSVMCENIEFETSGANVSKAPLVVRGNMLSRSIAQIFVKKSNVSFATSECIHGEEPEEAVPPRWKVHGGKPKHRDPTQTEPLVQYKNGRCEHPTWKRRRFLCSRRCRSLHRYIEYVSHPSHSR